MQGPLLEACSSGVGRNGPSLIPSDLQPNLVATSLYLSHSIMSGVATTRAWCRASKQLLRGFRASHGATLGCYSQRRCISNERPATAVPIARFAPRWNLQQIRHDSSTAVHRPLTNRDEPKQDDSESQEAGDRALRKAQEPAYNMVGLCYSDYEILY